MIWQAGRFEGHFPLLSSDASSAVTSWKWSGVECARSAVHQDKPPIWYSQQWWVPLPQCLAKTHVRLKPHPGVKLGKRRSSPSNVTASTRTSSPGVSDPDEERHRKLYSFLGASSSSVHFHASPSSNSHASSTSTPATVAKPESEYTLTDRQVASQQTRLFRLAHREIGWERAPLALYTKRRSHRAVDRIHSLTV